MKAIIKENRVYFARVRFNGEIEKVEDLNWSNLSDFTKSRLLNLLSNLLILRSDYELTDRQKEVISIAEERFVKYISKERVKL